MRNAIGEDYLIPLIKRASFVTPDFFYDAPKQFVIKTSNGGGGENVKVILDKSKLNDLAKLASTFNRYLNNNIGSKIDEAFYDIEEPQILLEKLLVHKNGTLPSDYKFHILKGERASESEFVIIQVDVDRFTGHKRTLYSESLDRLDFKIQPKYDDYIFPPNINEMISLAKRLALPFKYVRVDMNNVDGDIYFGELTFCHGSGWEPFSSKLADSMLGALWNEYN